MGRLHSWPDEFMLETARVHLTGAAANWFGSHQGKVNSFCDFERIFRKTFKFNENLTECWEKMRRRRQGVRENTVAYFHEKYALCKRLKLSFMETKEQILTGLLRRGCVLSLMAKEHADEDVLLHDIVSVERLSSNSYRESRWSSGTSREIIREVKTLKETEQERPSKQLSCFICKETTHKVKDCPNKKKCFTCGVSGHKSFECKQKRFVPDVANTTASVPAKETAVEQKISTGKTTSRVMSMIEENNKSDSIRKFCKKVMLAEKCVLNALIDPESAVCTIRASAVLNNDLNVVENLQELYGFGKENAVIKCGKAVKQKSRSMTWRPMALNCM